MNIGEKGGREGGAERGLERGRVAALSGGRDQTKHTETEQKKRQTVSE